MTGNHVYPLDELDEDLHHDLLIFYLMVFLFNADRSQLVFTSHDVAILSNDIFNDHRDTVWFVDKDKDTAASVYTRADEYGIHKNNSLYNFYMAGRLGAVLVLSSPYLDVESDKED